MKYFKYPHINKIDKKVYYESISRLNKKRKRHFRIIKFQNLCNITLYIIMVSGFILLYKYIANNEEMNHGLQSFLQIIIVAGIIFSPIIICVALLFSYYKLFPYGDFPKLERKAINERTDILKKYYHLNQD